MLIDLEANEHMLFKSLKFSSVIDRFLESIWGLSKGNRQGLYNIINVELPSDWKVREEILIRKRLKMYRWEFKLLKLNINICSVNFEGTKAIPRGFKDITTSFFSDEILIVDYETLWLFSKVFEVKRTQHQSCCKSYHGFFFQ